MEQNLLDRREELVKKYDGKLPDYLLDLFDETELDKITEEKKEKVSDKEFWEKHDTELVKHTRRNPKIFSPVWTESPRATDRIKEEVNSDSTLAKEICEIRLDAFAIRYFPHYLKKPNSVFHNFLYDTLAKNTGTNAKWAIAAPRRNAKSSIISCIYPIWCIVYNKKKFIILVSNTAGSAEDFLSDIKRELEQNEMLKMDFPFACSKGNVWRADEIITRNDVRIRALGTGSQIRGRKFGEYRPDVVTGDDIETSEMVLSKTQREKVRYEWFNKDVLYAGGEIDAPTDFFIVGTVLGKYSLLHALLSSAEYPDWKSKRFQAVGKFSTSPLWLEWNKIFKNPFDAYRQESAKQFFEDHKEEMIADTEVLWPEGDPYYDLMVDKLRDPRGFNSEKQNIALDPAALLVSFSDLTFRDFRDKEIQDMLRNATYFGALDPSLGKKQKVGDDSAIVTLARDRKTGIIFVVDMNVKRRSVDEQIDDILKFQDDFKYTLFGVETNAFQYVVADTLRKKSRAEGIYVPIKEITAYNDKKMRFEAVVPFINDGTIVFDEHRYKTDPMYYKGIEEITSFTGEGDEEDDCPDSLGYAFELAKKPRFRLMTQQTGK
jgi:predicted phage terminase large subunit-like protein